MTATTTTRRRMSAMAALLLVPTLAACGFDVQTNKQYQSGAGTDNRDAIVQVLNAAIVVPKVGATNGVFVGSFVNSSGSDPAEQANYTPGQTVTVKMIAITSPAGGGARPNITLAPNSSYNPQPTAVAGNHGIPLTVPDSVTDGGYVTVTFTFAGSSTQIVRMQVPVFPADAQHSYFAQYLPASPTKH